MYLFLLFGFTATLFLIIWTPLLSRTRVFGTSRWAHAWFAASTAWCRTWTACLLVCFHEFSNKLGTVQILFWFPCVVLTVKYTKQNISPHKHYHFLHIKAIGSQFLQRCLLWVYDQKLQSLYHNNVNWYGGWCRNWHTYSEYPFHLRKNSTLPFTTLLSSTFSTTYSSSSEDEDSSSRDFLPIAMNVDEHDAAAG